MSEPFKTVLETAIKENLQNHRQRIWMHGLQDLEKLVNEASEVLSGLTANVLQLTLKPTGKSSHVAGIGELNIYHLELWNMSENTSLGIFQAFQVPQNRAYPILTAQGMPIGDYEGLKVVLLQMFADPSTKVYELIASVCDCLEA